MTKTDVKMQTLKKVATENGKLYFPFSNNETVKAVIFAEKSKGRILVVEDFAEVSTIDNVASVDLGYLKTNCLVVEVENATEVEVLILKNAE